MNWAAWNVIRQIVEDCSGGIKFTELITILADRYHGSLYEAWNTPEEVENIIRNSGNEKLKILDYTWHSCRKTKMFVYTP